MLLGYSGAPQQPDCPVAGVHARGTVDRVRTLSYTVLYEPQPEGGYTVTVPALPGCITEGDTLEEARTMAEDAIRAYCESLIADGQPLPADIEGKPLHEKLTVPLPAA